ncbi:unnamed protein product [Gadus morhua 'NCC']
MQLPKGRCPSWEQFAGGFIPGPWANRGGVAAITCSSGSCPRMKSLLQGKSVWPLHPQIPHLPPRNL